MKSPTMIWFIILSFYFLLMSQYDYVEGSSSGATATAASSAAAASSGSSLSCDAVHTLMNSLAHGLQNAALFKSIIEAGISAQEAVDIVVSAFYITLTKLSVSSSTIIAIQKDFKNYMFNAGVSSSVTVYAQGVASSFIFGLLESGDMTESNIYAKTKVFFSTFLISLTEVASSDGISVIPSSASGAAASATSEAQASSNAGGSAASESAGNTLSDDVISSLIHILSNGLQNAAIFYDIIEAGIASQQAIQIVYAALHITLTKMSVSSSATAGIQTDFVSYIFNIGASVSVSLYAQAVSACFIYGLIESGDLTVSNKSEIIKVFFSTFLKALTEVAASDGINLI